MKYHMYMVLYPCQCFNRISRPNSINFVRGHFGRIIAEATSWRPSASVNMASRTPREGTSVSLPFGCLQGISVARGHQFDAAHHQWPSQHYAAWHRDCHRWGKASLLSSFEGRIWPSSKVHHAAGRGRGHHQRGQSGKPHQKARGRPSKALAASFRATAHHGHNWPDIVAPIRRQIGICTSGRIIHRDCGAVHLWQLPWFVRAEGHHLLQSTSWSESHPTDKWFHLGPDIYGDQEFKCSSEFVETSHRSLIRSTGRTSTSGTTICVWTSKAFFRTHILKHSSNTSRTLCIMLDSTSCRVHHLWRMTWRKATLICAADTTSASIGPRIRTSPGSDDPMDIGHQRDLGESSTISWGTSLCSILFDGGRHPDGGGQRTFISCSLQHLVRQSESGIKFCEWHREGMSSKSDQHRWNFS